ncbi:phosphoglycerate mutase family protein [Allosphingosinicella indica]|uniref:Histidine phosphatase superfamily (Branch 1) n=1 Tax=Allosphingosinicella indica TaxID=941907 RepID=A0A1X7GIG0_9SPHN|nr:phosphoglycerate mutase family protein [Allosphingosinicella indica]SMF70305.1 Histidine phosphatase superfamily (branch 1) [Allosphingosinicella indica]
MRMGLLIVPLLALAACATPAPEATEPVYYVTRHLNTPEGERDPDLTAEGRANADRLAARLAGEPPRVIYVSDYKRTRQTAAPIAARAGVTPKVYDPADTPALVAKVKAEGAGPVLIVGHSNTVPDIVEALGGARPEPLVHEDFGDLWTIRGGRSVREKYSE